MVTRHVETCNRPQVHDLVELWVEVGMGLGLVLTRFDFLPCHTIRHSADYQTVLTVNNVAKRHNNFSVQSLTRLLSAGWETSPSNAQKPSMSEVACSQQLR